jgi:hypothetical protein
MCRLSRNLVASTFWNPKGLSRPVMGLLLYYDINLLQSLLVNMIKIGHMSCKIKWDKIKINIQNNLERVTRNMDQKFIGEEKLDHRLFPRIVYLFCDYNKFWDKIWKQKYNRIKTLEWNILCKLVLNGANNAYLELSETTALLSSSHILELTLTIARIQLPRRFRMNAPSNCRFPKSHTLSTLKSAISLTLSNNCQQFQQIYSC